MKGETVRGTCWSRGWEPGYYKKLKGGKWEREAYDCRALWGIERAMYGLASCLSYSSIIEFESKKLEGTGTKYRKTPGNGRMC